MPDDGQLARNGNGYVRWSQFHSEQAAQEARFREAMAAQRAEVHESLRRAHDYHTGLHADWAARVERTEARVDEVESVIDQQRGARALVYFLIGSNLLLAAVGFITIVATASS